MDGKKKHHVYAVRPRFLLGKSSSSKFLQVRGWRRGPNSLPTPSNMFAALSGREVDHGSGNVTVMEKMGKLLTPWKWSWGVGEVLGVRFVSVFKWLMIAVGSLLKVGHAVNTVNSKYIEHKVGKWIGQGKTHPLYAKYAKIQPNIHGRHLNANLRFYSQASKCGVFFHVLNGGVSLVLCLFIFFPQHAESLF